jgi:hypothetical protein
VKVAEKIHISILSCIDKYAQKGVKTQKMPQIHLGGAIVSTKKVHLPYLRDL